MSWIDWLKERRKRKSYYDLLIWTKGVNLAVSIYNLTSKFPDEEKFGLVSQMRRSAVSIPSNIAEGYGRYNTKDFVHFLRIAKGSLFELDSQLILSWRLGFIEKESFETISKEIDEMQFMLYAFITKCSEK